MRTPAGSQNSSLFWQPSPATHAPNILSGTDVVWPSAGAAGTMSNALCLISSHATPQAFTRPEQYHSTSSNWPMSPPTSPSGPASSLVSSSPQWRPHDSSYPPNPGAATSDEPTTNVYVRHLGPDVTEADLNALGSRFGDVVSVRVLPHDDSVSSMANHPVLPMRLRAGFIMFETPWQAQHAVTGLHCMGIQAQYAQETVTLKLKRLADSRSTNLYLSNLPPHFDEHAIRMLFAPTPVCSARILREFDHVPEHERPSHGKSNGVGFARLETREQAEAAIKRLNKVIPPGAQYPIKLRFADSPEQRRYKQHIEQEQNNKRAQTLPLHNGTTPEHHASRCSWFDPPSLPYRPPHIFCSSTQATLPPTPQSSVPWSSSAQSSNNLGCFDFSRNDSLLNPSATTSNRSSLTQELAVPVSDVRPRQPNSVSRALRDVSCQASFPAEAVPSTSIKYNGLLQSQSFKSILPSSPVQPQNWTPLRLGQNDFEGPGSVSGHVVGTREDEIFGDGPMVTPTETDDGGQALHFGSVAKALEETQHTLQS
ncbi:hypothetical protein OIO90_001535 [Microbotryomycetes sp. JL221]|nr:hypothetical protein OIO90_001535 [Microbotryomycetes sp. JL221]